MRRRSRRSIPLSLLLLLFLPPSSPRAETVDAVCTMPWWNMEWNLVALGPIAQTFTSSRDRMDFVDLDLAEGSSNSAGVELTVRVHSGSLEGPVLGTSLPLLLPDGFHQIARFVFEPAVALRPDAVHVLEIVRVGESGYAMVRGSNEDPCPQGQAYLEGLPRSYADLWFQLGVRGSVAVEERGWGTWKATWR